MPTPKIIEVPEDESVVCPICETLIIDAEEGLAEQPRCPHIRFVYANGEAFEHDPEGLEQRLNAAQEKADEDGELFDDWEWLLAQSDKNDVILEYNDEQMACGALSFKVWVGIRRDADIKAACNQEVSRSNCKYFHPTDRFVRWMKAHYEKKHVYDIGAGLGHVSNALTEAGLSVIAVRLIPLRRARWQCFAAPLTTAGLLETQYFGLSIVESGQSFMWDSREMCVPI